LKNMKVNGMDDIPYIMEKKCLKPPTTGWFINMSICQHAKLVPYLQKPTDEINFCTWEVRKFSRLQPSASPPSISLGGNPLMNITLMRKKVWPYQGKWSVVGCSISHPYIFK
jgi:hypothetical protein